jgi:hypothetical protein
MFSDYGVMRAWKSFDWDVMDRLSAHGWIYDPKGKAKSVVFTPEGAAYARALVWEYRLVSTNVCSGVDAPYGVEHC